MDMDKDKKWYWALREDGGSIVFSEDRLVGMYTYGDEYVLMVDNEDWVAMHSITMASYSILAQTLTGWGGLYAEAETQNGEKE